MNYWKAGIYWASLIIGWFVTTFVLGFAVLVAAGGRLTRDEMKIATVVVCVLAFAAGHAYGRRQACRAV